MIHEDLPLQKRIAIYALIVLCVHGRDVLKKLHTKNITNPMDFNWLGQLRYYFENEILNICMIKFQFEYGWEYLGVTSRLVVTPLTDRCYRTLLSALYLHYSGAPEVRIFSNFLARFLFQANE